MALNIKDKETEHLARTLEERLPTGEPLLYRGEDLARTDIQAAGGS